MQPVSLVAAQPVSPYGIACGLEHRLNFATVVRICQATLDDASLVDESTSLWDNRLAGRTFQLHGQKVVADLLDFLFQNDLAWNPRHSDGIGYVEMHPRLGEAVLATLAH